MIHQKTRVPAGLVGVLRRTGRVVLVAGFGLASLLIWDRLRLMTDLPSTAYAVPEPAAEVASIIPLP